MNTLVIPSNRAANLRSFLAQWQGQDTPWQELIVVEDAPQCSVGIEADRHVCWADLEDDLGDSSWIISRRDSAIRSYGFYLAYQRGAEVIFTLDDDCLVKDPAAFVRQHRQNLFDTPRWTPSVSDMRTRGLPYFNLGASQRVKISHGLWSGLPDLDAVQSLSQGLLPSSPPFQPPAGTRVIPTHQYFPLCGMNLAFTRQATPLMYFPLMGEGVPYRRFDDIWCGVIAKKICDHLGWLVTSGEPHVIHARASDAMTNLVKEAPGIQRNETFWQDIDGLCLTQQTAALCMEELGQQLTRASDEYLAKLGTAIQTWARLFP